MSITVDLSKLGLCNRFKSLVSCMRLCDIYNKQLYLYWDGYNCSISDIFTNKFVESHTKPPRHSPSTYMPNWILCLLPEDVPPNFAQVKPKLEGRSVWERELKHGQCIDFEYDRIPRKIRLDFLSYFNKLNPIDNIKNRVDVFPKEMIGVHIRRGDHMKRSDRNMGTNEKFMTIMDKYMHEKSCTFYLSTDCDETANTFKRKYGRNIMMQEKISRCRNKQGAFYAMVDLLVLANSNHIIGSHLSTFTEVAWWFGGCGSIEIINK